jgi:hypothetical protein
MPVPVDAFVLDHSNPGIVDSKPAQGMDVNLIFVLSCVGKGIAMG